MVSFLAQEFHAFLTRAVFVVVAAFFIFASTVSAVHAAHKKGFEALQVLAPKEGFEIDPGATQTVTLGFQNIGTATWSNTGSKFVSVYTYGPKYRASYFKTESWKDFTQAALLKESSVGPGNVGHIDLTLKAPLSPGTYKETFHLAAENTAWIPGGEFTLVIKVKGKTEEDKGGQEVTTKDGTASPVSASGLSASVLIRSAKEVKAEAGEEINYRVGLKNTGTVTWNKREIRSSDLAIASVSTVHSSWISQSLIAVSESGQVKPGGLDLIDFTFTAPPIKGKHLVSYKLAVNDTIVPDFSIDIPVEVTTGAQDALESPLVEPSVPSDVIIPEPLIRIGVLIVDEETDWQVEISCDRDWKLVDGEGGLLGELKSGEMVRAFYKNQRYYFNRGKGIEQTYKYLRFVPNSQDAVCTIENFDRRKTRNAAYADNQFRDVLELRYNSAKDRTWVINELPVEEYLYGLAETSNVSHHEFKKTLVTVARTYALYHFERATKHASEYFHMNSTADDQVYKGYGYETRNPLIRQAVEDTRGVVSTYQNATAITPYFSRSDGRTRDWSEVWGGSVAWLKSVPAPCDKAKGRTLWGHGVGMSATEALCMANESGKTWQEILTYFYQGIELKKRWN